MAMLEYNEITERKYIVFENEPYEVISSHVFRKQQRKPVNATKMRSMLTGRIVEHSFHVSDKAEEADISRRGVKFLYVNKNEYFFCDVKDPSKRFPLTDVLVGDAGKFLKQNTEVDALVYDDGTDEGRIIGLKLPIKMDLKVIEAHPAVKGNTAQGGSKMVKVETGVELQVPMFIKEGDIIRINTETGDYTDRVTN
ncbi:MAG: efp, elongation factor elongation factor [Parcubacteria group bacterium]|nr:efp, elongation factor elongation factor [Parcubacteria group bacterium]